MKLSCSFAQFSQTVSWQVGRPLTFVTAMLIVVIWAATGPLFGYSDTWQLVINTSTTIITFLMVFLIQNTQNRDSIAIQVKLDELLRAIKEARNSIIDLDSLDEGELQNLLQEYRQLAMDDRAAKVATEIAARSAATSKHAAEAESSSDVSGE
ncbi:MAG: rane protein [Planctomycetaceae bacterium]|nr:rane protein [Planctomycetaceae bacterium]